MMTRILVNLVWSSSHCSVMVIKLKITWLVSIYIYILESCRITYVKRISKFFEVTLESMVKLIIGFTCLSV